MKKAQKFLIFGLILAAAAGLDAPPAMAEFPDKPIHLLGAFRAGGRIDTLARLLGKELQGKLGQPVIVTAKPGGGGTVMASQLKNAPADGYTLGISVTITWAFNPFYRKNAPYGINDFSYVATISEGKPALFSNIESPWVTLNDLVADAKKRTKPMAFVSLAPSVRLQINSIARKEGITFRIIPARGGAAAVPMILGKHADFAFSGGFHHTYAVAKKLRVLAFTDRQHHADLPGVKTLDELGYESFPPGYTVVAAPKGVPSAILAKISAALREATSDPRVMKAMATMNAPASFHDAVAAEKIMHAQAKYFKRLIDEEKKSKSK